MTGIQAGGRTEVLRPSRVQVLYLAGNPWNAVVGTDRRMAEALGRLGEVWWVDPPVSAARWLCSSWGARRAPLELLPPHGVRRLRRVTVPGNTRPVLRVVARIQLEAALRRWLPGDAEQRLIVVAHPLLAFPDLPGVRALYLTADWVRGAGLMGVSRRLVTRQIRRNLAEADLLAAVTPRLLAEHRPGLAPSALALLLPDGPPRPDRVAPPRPADVPSGPYALLVGDLDERLNVDCLQAVADADVPLVLIGPRTERDLVVRGALDRLLTTPGVLWLGERPSSSLPAYLSAAAVGLIPDTSTTHDLSMFPMQTLEYLAAGLPVVTTDIPALSWMGCDEVVVACDAHDFARAAAAALRASESTDPATARRTGSTRTDWDARAATLLESAGLA